MTRYYSTQRPIGPGTIPNNPKPMEIHNFDHREFVEEIGRQAWGFVDYEEPLEEKEACEYELVRERQRYRIRFSVRGHFTADVSASDAEEAKEEAMRLFEEADFGELEEADGDLATIEDADGRCIE